MSGAKEEEEEEAELMMNSGFELPPSPPPPWGKEFLTLIFFSLRPSLPVSLSVPFRNGVELQGCQVGEVQKKSQAMFQKCQTVTKAASIFFIVLLHVYQHTISSQNF